MIAALASATAAIFLCAGAAASEFAAGGYSFSDELGGFKLVSASGTGSSADPIVVVEEIVEVQPVVLVIRRLERDMRTLSDGLKPLNLVKVVVNRSHRVWGGFELELQEVLREPSVYSDGLSFNQFGAKPPDVGSDSFSDNRRLFEPYDRIRFEDGHVDPDATARFSVTITDPTPAREFYLVQDPQLLSAERDVGTKLADKAR